LQLVKDRPGPEKGDTPMKPVAPSEEGFADLVSKYRNGIRRYILSVVRDPAVAEDLTQETFLRAFRKLETLRDDSKISAWLYRISTNLCRDHYRRTSRSPYTVSFEASREDESAGVPETRPDADRPPLDQWLEQDEMSACVQAYLEELPDAHRAAVLLHDLEGMTDSEIAEMLGCSVGAVKIRLHRARTKLKSALESGCDFSTDRRGVFVCEPKERAIDPS
jgi:RNA polymerase sigma-70 factor (ECF subfamily)